MFSKILNRIIFVLVLITTLTPLIYRKKLFYAFESEKGLFFRFLIEIIFGLWLILILKNPELRPKKSPINIVIALFAVILVIVDVFGVDTYLSVFSNFERMAGLILYLCVFGYFLVISSIINTSKRWIIFGVTLSIIAFIVSTKGIIQSYNREEMIANFGRVVTTIGNANQLATYLLFGFFLVTMLLTKWIIPLRKANQLLSILLTIISAFFLLIYLVCLIKTSTRGALIGLILGGILMLILIFFKIKQRRVKFITGTFLLILFFAVSGLFYFRNHSIIYQNSALSRLTRISDLNGTNTIKSRLDNYQVAFDGIKEKPLLGWGQETFHYTYAKYFNPKLYNDATWYDRTHNIILEWLIIGGMLGLIAYLGLWAIILHQLWKKNNRLETFDKIIISGFLLAYFISNLSLFDNLLGLMTFMVVAGFINQHSIVNEEKQSIIVPNKIIWAGSFLILLVSYFLIKITCIEAYQTNKAIVSAYNSGSLEEVIDSYSKAYPKAIIGRQEIAEQFASIANDVQNGGVPEPMRKLFFEKANDIMKIETAKHPDYARLQIIYGNLLETQSENLEAMKVFEKVEQLSPQRQSSLMQLAILYAKNNQFNKAINLLQKTYLLETKNEEPKAYQAIVYAMKIDRLNRDKAIKKLSEDALNKYIDKVKYAFAITNDLDKFIKSVDKTTFKTTEQLYHEWATAAYSIKDYQESARAVNIYRLHYWGYKFVDNRPLNIIHQEILNGKNPEFTFEKIIE